MNSAIGGQRVGKFKDKGRRFDIRVRLLAPQRQRPEDIQRLLVRTGQGGLVRLGDIVHIEQRPTLQTITRRDRERAITIFANVSAGVSQDDAIDRSLATARKILPDGYRAIPSGNSQAFAESFQSLWFAFALGLIVAYMVLATQFNAFSHPFTVLLALPFSISGALIALWLAGQSLNVYSVLGMILLMGIAKKNSILLVDFTNQLREQGAERHEALLEACPLRLRPILMTSIATIAGALPPALAIGPGAELQRPMALALVGRHVRLHAAHPVRGARGLQPSRRRDRLEPAAARAGRGARGRALVSPRFAIGARLGIEAVRPGLLSTGPEGHDLGVGRFARPRLPPGGPPGPSRAGTPRLRLLPPRLRNAGRRAPTDRRRPRVR